MLKDEINSIPEFRTEAQREQLSKAQLQEELAQLKGEYDRVGDLTSISEK